MTVPTSRQPRILLPGVSDEVNDTLAALVAQLDAHRARNLHRADRYDGKHAVRHVGTIIPPQYRQLAIVLGWSAKAVDILARRCNLDAFTWTQGDLDTLGWDELNADGVVLAELSQGITSSLIHGPAFLVTTEGDEDAGEPPALLHVKDAMNATGEWDWRRRELRNLLSVTARDDENDHITGLALYLDGVTITAEKDAGTWTVDQQDHPWGVPADVMVYKPRPGRAFGSSRISRPVMSLHDQALRTVIRMEAHSDIYAIPDLWMLGADEAIFRNADGTAKASWQVVMGRIKGLPDAAGDEARGDSLDRADVKQFPASSPEPHIMTLKQQAQLFAGETSVPLTSLGVSDMSNPTSADSYIASREDLIAEAEGATDDWTRPMARAVRRLLAIANGEPEVPREWLSIVPKWRSPLYLSRAAAADAGAKQLGAVPWLAETEVGLELLGLDGPQIKRAMAEREAVAAQSDVAVLARAIDRQTAPTPAAPVTAAPATVPDGQNA